MKFFDRYRAELRLSLRVVAASLAAYGVNRLLHLPQGYWTVLTAVLVVQGSVGGSIRAALDRVIGTVAGACYGALIALLVPHADPYTFALSLAAGLVPTAFAAAISPSFRIAPVTVIVVLYSAVGAHISVVEYALDRMTEISLGALLGLGTSLVFLPARAHALFAERSAHILDLYAGLLALLIGPGAALEDQAVETQHTEIRAVMGRLDEMAMEAVQERRSHLAADPDPEPLQRTLRRLRHDIIMIGRVLPGKLPATAALSAALGAMQRAVTALLGDVSASLRGRTKLAPPETETAFAACAAAVAELRASPAFDAMTGDEAGRLFTLNFVLEQLHRDLLTLIERAREFEKAD